MQHTERVHIVCVCVCVCVCVFSRRGRDSGVQLCQYSSVSTALVVVNTGSFVSDLWLCDQFLWPILATLSMSHWFKKCLACKLYKDNTCVCLSLWQWDFTCRAHFSSECWFLRLSVRAFSHQLLIIVCFCFLDQNVCFDWILSLVACIAEMAEQLPFSCLC